MKESEVLKACREYLSFMGVYHWRQNAGVIPLPGGGVRFSGKKGLPDIFAIIPPHGTLMGIETKRPGGKLSPEQIKFHDDLVKLGGISCVVTSVEELARDLKLVITTEKDRCARPAKASPEEEDTDLS